MKNTDGIDIRLMEMGARIADLREVEGIPAEKMAEKTGVPLEEYLECEAGRSDMSFAFIYRCAQELGVDVTDIIEGTSPNLSNYTVTRSECGRIIESAHGMTYYSLAGQFKNRVSDPLYVVAKYSKEA